MVARACSYGRTGLDAENFSFSLCCWALEETKGPPKPGAALGTNEVWDTAQAEMPCAGRMANGAQQWGGERGLSVPTHLPANATDGAGSHCLEKKPDLGGDQRHQEGAGK